MKPSKEGEADSTPPQIDWMSTYDAGETVYVGNHIVTEGHSMDQTPGLGPVYDYEE